MEVYRAIKDAATKRTLLEITYQDAKGNITTRSTEPYEIKDEAYFGYDVDQNSIKKFKLDRIIDAKVLNTPYVARWSVLI